MATGRRPALGVHPRARVPGPDQGQARDRRKPTRIVENGGARSLRPLAHRQSAAGQPPARLGGRPRRGAASPPEGKGDRPARPRRAAAPARQARRLRAERGGRHRDLHRRGRFGRRLGQAGARPRDARRCCPCAARSSTSPAPARTSSPTTSSSPISSRRSAAAPARNIATRTCATRRSSS